MSEIQEQPLTPAEPVAATGNEPTGNADWDAAVQQAQTEQPTAETDAPPTETQSTETPTEVKSEPNAPAPDFTFATLQNGEQEVRLANGEVYRGKTEREVLEKLAAGKMETNRYVQTLKTQQQPVSTQQTPPTTSTAERPQMDATTMAIVDMIAPAFGVKSGQELIASYQKMQQDQQGFGQVAEQAQLRALAQDFVQTTPDFVLTAGNAAKLEQTLDQYGLPPTMQNMQLVHNALKGQGVYETLPARTNSGQFALKNTMPPPPSSSAPAATTGKGTPTEADLWNMPTDKLFELLQNA